MSEMEKAENARIVSTMLGKEDHGIPTFILYCDQDGVQQGFGGYDLRWHAHHTLIFDILDALGVSSWEKLVGTFCRIRREVPCGPILMIGNIVEDKWVDMRARVG